MSSEDDTLSDEKLHAFVDDELNASDRAAVMAVLRVDGELAARVCELLHLKDSIRLAYSEPPRPDNPKSLWHSTRTNTRKTNWRISAVAATLLLGTGALAGWAINAATPHSAVPLLSDLNTETLQTDTQMVVVHIRTTDPARLEKVLDQAEQLLDKYAATPEKVQLEIIADATGLAFLRADISPFVGRIRKMAHKYQNLSFMACSQTIRRMEKEGTVIHIIPEVKIIKSGADRIFSRLQKGWTYISA